MTRPTHDGIVFRVRAASTLACLTYHALYLAFMLVVVLVVKLRSVFEFISAVIVVARFQTRLTLMLSGDPRSPNMLGVSVSSRFLMSACTAVRFAMNH